MSTDIFIYRISLAGMTADRATEYLGDAAESRVYETWGSALEGVEFYRSFGEEWETLPYTIQRGLRECTCWVVCWTADY